MKNKVSRLRTRGSEVLTGSHHEADPGFGPYGSASEFVRQWLFHPEFYASQAAGLVTELPPTSQSLWAHFLHKGQFQDLSPSPFMDIAFARKTATARGADGALDIFQMWRDLGSRFVSGPLFDPTHYLMRNADVRSCGLDPFFHWMLYGIFEGRSPSPYFVPHALGDLSMPDEERRRQIHEVTQLDFYVDTHAETSAVNVSALRSGFPDQEPFSGMASGVIPFCTDPQILFGNVTDVVIQVPLTLDVLTSVRS